MDSTTIVSNYYTRDEKCGFLGVSWSVFIFSTRQIISRFADTRAHTHVISVPVAKPIGRQ